MKRFLFLFVLFLLFFVSACGETSGSGTVKITIKDEDHVVLFDEKIDFTEEDTLVSLLENHQDILMKGETSEFGLYITELCGVGVDYSYWAVYLNGDYAMVGISRMTLTDQDEIEFVLTPFE